MNIEKIKTIGLSKNEINIYKKYHSVINMVVSKFKFNLCYKSLSIDDLQQKGELIYIRAIKKLDIDTIENINAYLWKAIYRQLKIYIEKQPDFICYKTIYENYDKNIMTSIVNNIDKNRLKFIIQTILSKLNNKKKYIMESFFGLNNKDIISQAQIGRTLGMTYQGVKSAHDVIIKNIKKDKELMTLLKEFKNF